MSKTAFHAFVKAALATGADESTPPDYLPTRVEIAAQFPKLAMGNLGLASSIAGLGVLGRPAARRLRGKEDLSERSKDMHEAVGLGMIAGPEIKERYYGSKGHFGKMVGKLRGAAGRVH